MLLTFCRRWSSRSAVQVIRRFCSEMTDSGALKRQKMSEDRSRNIIWVDLEMTGLDVEKCRIIEMACLVTDGDLNVVAEGPNLIINQPDGILDEMGEWCQKHHGESGLTQAVKESKISQDEAEKTMLTFVQDHTDAGKCPLAGNSIHMDRMFLNRYMPRFTSHLHYRVIDVSTIKELSRRWFPKEFLDAPKKKLSHRALDDIKESIEELRHYQKSVFKS